MKASARQMTHKATSRAWAGVLAWALLGQGLGGCGPISRVPEGPPVDKVLLRRPAVMTDDAALPVLQAELLDDGDLLVSASPACRMAEERQVQRTQTMVATKGEKALPIVAAGVGGMALSTGLALLIADSALEYQARDTGKPPAHDFGAATTVLFGVGLATVLGAVVQFSRLSKEDQVSVVEETVRLEPPAFACPDGMGHLPLYELELRADGERFALGTAPAALGFRMRLPQMLTAEQRGSLLRAEQVSVWASLLPVANTKQAPQSAMVTRLPTERVRVTLGERTRQGVAAEPRAAVCAMAAQTFARLAEHVKILDGDEGEAVVVVLDAGAIRQSSPEPERAQLAMLASHLFCKKPALRAVKVTRLNGELIESFTP